jgi:hypothetical protein
VADRLYPGETLTPNQYLTSKSGELALVMQADGNLVLYAPGGQHVWEAGTDGQWVSRAVMQEDGNFVLYGPVGAIWSSHTHDHPGSSLVLQDDGNVVVFNPERRPLWASGTHYDRNAPLTVSKDERVGDEKRLSTTATLYRDGLLVLDVFSKCTHPFEPLRGDVAVVAVNAAGRAHWVSEILECTTAAGIFDPSYPSQSRETFSRRVPEAVARRTARLEIFQGNRQGLTEFRARLIDGIKEGVGIDDAVVQELRALT